jgi:hypothetical protein
MDSTYKVVGEYFNGKEREKGRRKYRQSIEAKAKRSKRNDLVESSQKLNQNDQNLFKT